MRSVVAACFVFLLLSGCSGPSEHVRSMTSGKGQAGTGAEVARNPLKDVYFGDLHIHTSWSLDAFAFGVRVGPEDAYRYVRGESIEHVSGRPIQMQGPPLDFIALTEHANYMGVPTAALEEGTEIRALPLIQGLLSADAAVNGAAMAELFAGISTDTLIPELRNDAVVESTWERIIQLADRHTVPGEFTAFVAYEYTSMPGGQNLHRNVVFRGSDVPRRPFSTFDSQKPEDLWGWMDRSRKTGSDLIAIPHNANGSNGLMYEKVDQAGRPIDASYAEIRLRNEPVSEVLQIKGQSETHPDLSPNDEWAAFQILETILGRPSEKSQLEGSYARLALMDGLEMKEKDGFNPYRFGMIGASDGHNASSPVEENNFTGKIGVVDGTPEVRLGMLDVGSDLDVGDRSNGSPFSAAGLAGVWAEANTRGDLFDALRTREVFATSGPRIRVRLFGGWGLSEQDLGSELAAAGYARGVPMGGELEAQEKPGDAPTFLLQASRDPREAPLERMQIVKAWVQDGSAREAVYDVACADGLEPDTRTHRCRLSVSLPDLEGCGYDESRGRSELSAAWSDPDFEATQHAFYYARVLQIPTCRWSTFDAQRLGVPRPPGAPAWLQERAVTSPIWFAPAT